MSTVYIYRLETTGMFEEAFTEKATEEKFPNTDLSVNTLEDDPEGYDTLLLFGVETPTYDLQSRLEEIFEQLTCVLVYDAMAPAPTPDALTLREFFVTLVQRIKTAHLQDEETEDEPHEDMDND